MEITVRYRYAASIGSLVWALTKRESDREGAFDWGKVTGTLDRGGGKWPTYLLTYLQVNQARDLEVTWFQQKTWIYWNS